MFPPLMNSNPLDVQDGGKTAGMMSYFFILGWSLAYFGYHQTNKTSLSSFQLRQTLLLFTAYLGLRFALTLFLRGIWHATGIVSLTGLTGLVDVSFVVLWVIGLMGAINGQEKPIPLLGRPAQNLFSNI
jgi:uncharacterized membrane protein